jgi:hypothetical protein
VAIVVRIEVGYTPLSIHLKGTQVQIISPCPGEPARESVTAATVRRMSRGTDAMSDVYAKLRWAEKHQADLMAVGHEYLRADGGDERPLGVEFDYGRPPVVVAKFIVDEPMPDDIGLHAGDLIHNARTALDHVLARLKDHLGGDARRGTFPITESDADWKGRVYPRRDGKRDLGPLDGLTCSARRLIYLEQPHIVYAGKRNVDPMVIMSRLDNDDKHRLLHHGFAYPTAERGLDLIDVRDPTMVLSQENVWTSGQPVQNGTVMARYRLHPRANPRKMIRIRRNAQLRLSAGPVDAPPVTYDDIIARVRAIADKSAALIDLL